MPDIIIKTVSVRTKWSRSAWNQEKASVQQITEGLDSATLVWKKGQSLMSTRTLTVVS